MTDRIRSAPPTLPRIAISIRQNRGFYGAIAAASSSLYIIYNFIHPQGLLPDGAGRKQQRGRGARLRGDGAGGDGAAWAASISRSAR